MRNLGLVVFSNNSGLGNQSRRLAQFMKPEQVLLIDSTSFSKNTEQHPEWYDGFTGYISKGFPNKKTVDTFLRGLTHLYIIENPLNWYMLDLAKHWNIKTYIASNYEFCDNLNQSQLPLPDKFLMPSYWMVEDMKNRFGDDRVEYLPPPLFLQDFVKAREYNLDRKRKRRFLHVIGTLAAEDRNGTKLLLEALKYTDADFELVIKSQHDLPADYFTQDRRVKYMIGNEPEVENIYYDFDGMIIPRRFGGLCLPMCEALACALPVIMPDISPNNQVLPKEWLVSADQVGKIRTRTEIPLFNANVLQLAQKITDFVNLSDNKLLDMKLSAVVIADLQYSPASLEVRYNKLWN